MVTRFGFRLHRVGPAVLAGMVIHPLEAAHKVLAYYRDLVEDAPDALGTIVNLRLCPPISAVPAHLHGAPVLAMVVCWSGDLDDGAIQLRPLREFGRPILDTIAPMTYVDLQHLVDATVVPGNHYYWRSADFERLTDGVIDTVSSTPHGSPRRSPPCRSTTSAVPLAVFPPTRPPSGPAPATT